MENNNLAVSAHFLDIIDYRIRFARPLSPAEATGVRGYFGGVFAKEVALHHHNADGSLLYDYPRVQFKVLDRTAHLIGIAEGATLVSRLWTEVEAARIGAEELPVLESTLTRRKVLLGESTDTIPYRLRTPWLGLNQNNHRVYENERDSGARRSLLERVLIGNCLSIAKSFGLRVTSRLTAEAYDLSPRTVRLKGVEMLGFYGVFRINFCLPDRVGIGKSVSRGFGTVERTEEESPC